MQVHLTRERQLTSWDGTWYPEHRQWGLCATELAEWFSIPDSITELDLVVLIHSTRDPCAYRVRHHVTVDGTETDYVQVDLGEDGFHLVWVDHTFAEFIGEEWRYVHVEYHI